MPWSNRRWQLPAANPIPPEMAALPPPLAQMLRGRGLDTMSKLRGFLEPPHQLPYNPLRLSGMAAALQRLTAAMQRREVVGIVGDFDVDGVTGTALLQDGLTAFGIPAIPYLPHRVAEGHGLSAAAVKLLHRHGVQLIITVDCGVASVAETALARSLGMEVIITDHHIPPEMPPAAAAILNPRMPGNEYPFPQLCGAGLAFKLMQGFYQWQGRPLPGRLAELAALGTIADLVPLQDENRFLVQAGLQELAATGRPGLQALYRQAGLNPAALDAATVAFQIAPRLNAPGRMAHARDSLQLLTTADPAQAEALAQHLESLNQQRRELTARIYARVQAAVAARPALPPFILVTDPELTPGVAGLVAGRLVEDFHRPAAALAPVADDQYIASGRSIPGFNLAYAFADCADLLLRYGGHAQAGGFAITAAHIPQLEQRLTALADEQLTAADLQPILSIDAELELSALTPDLLAWLNRLEPFGVGNPQPRFLTRNLRVTEVRTMGGRGQHLKLQVEQGGQRCPVLAFNRAEEWAASLTAPAAAIDLVYSLNLDTWQGVKRLNLLAADFRMAGGAFADAVSTPAYPAARSG